MLLYSSCFSAEEEDDQEIKFTDVSLTQQQGKKVVKEGR